LASSQPAPSALLGSQWCVADVLLDPELEHPAIKAKLEIIATATRLYFVMGPSNHYNSFELPMFPTRDPSKVAQIYFIKGTLQPPTAGKVP
jgi:hypothetical protein